MGARLWTDEEIEKLRQYVKEDKSGTECAKLLNRHPSSIYVKKQELGLKSKSDEVRPFKMQIRREKIKKFIESGYSIKQIAEELGISEKTVYELGKQCGYSGTTFVGIGNLPGKPKKTWATKRFGVTTEQLRKMSNEELRGLCLKCPVDECDNCLKTIYKI